MGTGTGKAYREQAKRIGNGHSVSGTGTAYRERAQRIVNGHSVLRRTENQDSHKAFREEIQDGEQSTGERQLTC